MTKYSFFVAAALPRFLVLAACLAQGQQLKAEKLPDKKTLKCYFLV